MPDESYSGPSLRQAGSVRHNIGIIECNKAFICRIEVGGSIKIFISEGIPIQRTQSMQNNIKWVKESGYCMAHEDP